MCKRNTKILQFQPYRKGPARSTGNTRNLHSLASSAPRRERRPRRSARLPPLCRDLHSWTALLPITSPPTAFPVIASRCAAISSSYVPAHLRNKGGSRPSPLELISLLCRWGFVKTDLDFPTGGDSFSTDTVCRSHHTAARCGDTLDGKCTVLPYSVVTAPGAVVFSVRE